MVGGGGGGTVRGDNTPAALSLISGGVAGGIEAFVTYPIELTKTRAQLQRGSSGNSGASSPSVPVPRNPYRQVWQILQREGARALYRGCGVSVVGSVAKDAVRFASFDAVRNSFRDPETGTLTPARSMLAGMAAGVVASTAAVTPTERIKTALIDDARAERRFRGTGHAVATIVREDGPLGLYRGFVGTTLKQATATSFRLGSYNIVKEFEQVRGIPQNTAVNFANGALAGLITTLCTQPFDTIKTRSQMAHATTTMEAVRGIYQDYGLKGFFRGTVLRLSRTVLSGGILFTSAEAVAKIIKPLLAP